MKYLTPNQYVLADEGLLSTANLSPITLRRYISLAETMVDAYCGFDARLGGFEPHNIWYQTKWDKDNLKTRIPIWPVPPRVAIRYRIQVSMIGGNATPDGFFATIQPGDIAYNTYGNYVEIVPLQAVLYSMLPVLIELGMNPPIVQLEVEMGYYIDSLNEPLVDSGDHKTYYALRGFWAQTYDSSQSILPHIPPVVYQQAPPSVLLGQTYTQNPGAFPWIVSVNGTAQTTGFAVNATEGSVTFTSAQASSAAITASYTYQIPDPIREAAVNQTTYLLAQRDLSRGGMRALDSAINAQQTLIRHNRKASGGNASAIDEPGMDPFTMQLLQPYRQWPVA